MPRGLALLTQWSVRQKLNRVSSVRLRRSVCALTLSPSRGISLAAHGRGVHPPQRQETIFPQLWRPPLSPFPLNFLSFSFSSFSLPFPLFFLSGVARNVYTGNLVSFLSLFPHNSFDPFCFSVFSLFPFPVFFSSLLYLRSKIPKYS